MPHILDRALHKYENSDIVIQMKARFFFFLCLIILIILPVTISYTACLHLQNPILGYRIDFAILMPQIIAFGLFIAILVLLIRGYFTASAHVILILLLLTAWTVMIEDRSFIVSRLDTIAFIFGILTLTPLAVARNGTAIIVYGGINLAMLFMFMFFFGEQFNIPRNSLIDYTADNTIALAFMTITAFSIFAINRRALDRANREIRERAHAEEALRESEERYRTLFENSRDAIVILEAPSWNYVSVNKAALDMFRIDLARLDVPITGPWDLAPEVQPGGENSRDMALSMLEKALTDGWCFFEYRHRRLNGEEFPATVLLSKCELRNRTLVQATMRDVTERKRAEEQIRVSLHEKEVLLKEIHHRVKNNMQIIISLLSLQTVSIKDQDLLRIYNDSMNRIRAMALVHEKLYQSGEIGKIDFTSYIATIAEDLVNNSILQGKPLLRIEGETIHLGIDQAIPCGLIVNELITNTLKYAFPERADKDAITISLSHDAAGTITLRIRDNGVGMAETPDPKEISTLGLQLVHVLIDQIGGRYRVDRDPGTAWTITFPSSKTLAAD